MMRRYFVMVSTALLLLANGAEVKPNEPKDARVIIDKAIIAMGGEANLAKYKAATWNQKGKNYHADSDGKPFTGRVALQWPAQYRLEIEGEFTFAINKDNCWFSSGGEAMEMSEKDFAVQKQNHRVSWINTLVPLKDKAFQLKVLPDAKVGDELAHVVQVSHKEHLTVTLYFDKKTSLLKKSEYRTKAADLEFKEVLLEYVYSDHREIDGIMMPHKTVIRRDGKLLYEIVNTEIRFSPKLDEKLFIRRSDK